MYVTESTLEDNMLEWLRSIGWKVRHGDDVAPDSPNPLRTDYGEVIFRDPLKNALSRINPNLPKDVINDAQRKLTHPSGATLEATNRSFHHMVTGGVTVEYSDNGRTRGAKLK